MNDTKKPMGGFWNQKVAHSVVEKEGVAPTDPTLDLEKELKTEAADIHELEEEMKSVGPCEPSNVLQTELVDLKSQLEEAEEKVLRAYAEMENVRRRAQQDVERARRYGLEKFVEELIPALDSLEKATEKVIADDNTKSMYDGIQLTLRLLLKAFEKFGVRQICPLHEPFDPRFHQAIATQETKDFPANTIISVLQKGYVLNDRVVRPAMVIVSKAS